MQIKVIDFGYKHLPNRAHANDAGADVFSTIDYTIKSGECKAVPLGLGLELPDGYAAFIYPRSGLSRQGIVCELPPIDSGYRGEIHAIVSNVSNNDYTIEEGARVGQLVVVPVIMATFSEDTIDERLDGAFGSTGK